MKTIDLKHYEAPVIGVLEIEVERGFAVSGAGGAGGEGGIWKNPFDFGGSEDWSN